MPLCTSMHTNREEWHVLAAPAKSSREGSSWSLLIFHIWAKFSDCFWGVFVTVYGCEAYTHFLPGSSFLASVCNECTQLHGSHCFVYFASRIRSLCVEGTTTKGWRPSNRECWMSSPTPSPCSMPTSPTRPSSRRKLSVSTPGRGRGLHLEPLAGGCRAFSGKVAQPRAPRLCSYSPSFSLISILA